MTNEEFQKLVLEKFENLETGQKYLETSVKGLETGQKYLETSVKGLETSVKGLETSVKGLETSIKDLELGQNEIRKDIGAIAEQTADLTEFREEVKDKLDTLVQESLSVHEILGQHEVAIRTLRRRVI